ncbi:MAG: LemA family protein [Clostridia bacterium]|nr:LemA family protein [Clostridia bacterium]
MSETNTNYNSDRAMATFFIIVMAILLIVVTIVLPIFSFYNKIQTKKEEVKKTESDIGLALQKRNNLIPNLVSTVEAYTKNEAEIIKEIAHSRSRLINSIENNDVKKANEANTSLNSALNRLLVNIEKYPELKSSEHFKTLENQLLDAENEIIDKKESYNDTVKNYNNCLNTIPTKWFAGDNKEAEYWETLEKEKDLPEVTFND